MTYIYSKKALVLVAAGVFFIFVAVYFTSHNNQIYSLQGATMGTTWTVQIVAASDENLPAVGQKIETLLHHLDREVFSTYTADSELSQLNASPNGSSVVVSAELMTVLLLAKNLHELTTGVFDITIGSLVNLWGFGPTAVTGLPASSEIHFAKAQLGMADLILDEGKSTVFKNKMLTLDLSAIAKGYATDEVAEALITAGFYSFLVEIGGEIRVQGLRPDHTAWVIAIETPLNDQRLPYAALVNLGEPIGIAGSGDYRNFREIKGKRYSHEIDPRTGYPIDNNLAAVTVISANAATADAWATALMVLGAEQGKALAESENVAAYFITRDNFPLAQVKTEQAALHHTYTSAFELYLYPISGI